MIGNVANFGKGFKGCIQYNILGERGTKKENEIRGEFIYSQNLDSILLAESPIECPIDELVSEFHEPLKLGKSKVQNPVLHQSLSFPPGEKVDNETLEKICIEFSNWFGLKNNQMVVYKHSDKKHEHVHIVANRVDIDGVNSYRDSNNFYETGKFCRYVEQKFGLQKTKQMDSLKIDGKGVTSENKLHVQLRQQIDMLLVEVSSTKELRHALLQKGWKSYEGRGISFVHKASGTSIKGSELGRNYSLNGLQKLIERAKSGAGETGSNEERMPERELLKSKIAKNSIRASDLNMFVSLMNGDGYGVHFREYKNKQGQEKKSIAFSKSFSGKSNALKYVTGLELGASYGFYNVSKNIGAGKWSEAIPSPTRLKSRELARGPEKEVVANADINKIARGLNDLLTSYNAGKVEADAAKSVARVEAEIARNAAGYNNPFGQKGIEELKREGKRKKSAKTKKPRL